VDQASQRLHKLINEILDFSKIEAKRLVIYKARFNLSNCLSEVVALMSLKAQQKNLPLKLYVAPEVPEFVEGDQYRLGQILTNLIGNAIKFTDEGEVRVSVQRQNNLLEFAISDTGIGIPENKLATIFETFIQADGSSTRKYSGTGLGLSICKGLVELMGGRVKVISQVGQGSVFTFTLPMESHDSVS
jgi:signal transduction histidine kinase